MSIATGAPRPFSVQIAQTTINDIMRKVAAFSMPDAPVGGPGGAWAYGADAGFMKTLIEYWLHGYDWRAAETGLGQPDEQHAERGDANGGGIPHEGFSLDQTPPASKPPIALPPAAGTPVDSAGSAL